MLGPMKTLRAVACAAVIAGIACGNTGGDDTGEPTDVLVVSPATAQLEVRNGVEATQAYTVARVSASGDMEDVTARVQWSVVDGTIGVFSGTTFRATGGRAGKTMVRAALDDLVGEAQVEVTLKGARVGENVPANVEDLFAGGTNDTATAPLLVYPPDQVIVPANLGDLEAHWTDAHGHDLFELSLLGDHVDMRVYVRAGSTGWAGFTVSEWEAAARSSDELYIRLRALTEASPGVIGLAADRTVRLTNDDLLGGLYYWGTPIQAGQNYGIFRFEFGATGAVAEEAFTVTQAGRCVACHALSRDGTRMAVSYDGGNNSSTIVDVGTQTAMIAPLTQYWNFAAYTADGSRLVTSRDGVLSVRDGTSGAVLGTVPTDGYGTHPDFAATGTAMAFTRVTAPGQDWHFGGGTIATIPYEASTGTFGTATTIVGDGGNNYYPSFSPDGQWILFNRSSEDAYDDATAELWVVRADGSSPPRRLDLANVGSGLTNSWGRWAPFRNTFGRTNAESLYWITFSSKRAFGVRTPGGQPQLWMAPFFPGRAEQGGDPTAPAFRLPFQDLGSNNHIAQWTETVVPIGRMQETPAPPERARR